MITYRMETQPPTPSASSRVFGYVAAAAILIALLVVGLVVVLTRRSLEITIIAKNDTKTITAPLKISTNPTASLTGTVTTTVFHYSEEFYPTGTKVVDAAATGQVTLTNKTSSVVTLVKTTRLLTPEGALFRLTDLVLIPANGQITANVYADKPGKTGEIAPSHFTIPGLSSDKQAVVYADSAAAMTGGVRTSGILSQKDLDDAKKTFKNKVLAVYLSTVTSSLAQGAVPVAMVSKENSAADKKVGDEVTSFHISGDTSIVMVTYQKDQVLSALQKQLRSQIDVTSEKIVSANQEPAVTLVAYNAGDGTADLSVTEQVTVTIDPNADKLAPGNFFEKSKDEIERYLMSLDHVGQVDVQFSPSWINSAPKDADKIKVIVKDI